MYIDSKIKFMVFSSSLLLMFFICGCSSGLSNTKENMNTESIMKEGDKIVATNPFGILTIIAGKGNIRYLALSGKGIGNIEWSGDTVCIKLTEGKIKNRDSLMGFRCDSNVKKIRRKDGYGYARVEMGEAQMHFDNLMAAKKFLDPNAYNEWRNPEVWSSNGLYIFSEPVDPEYWIFPSQSYLSIELFQIYIGGNKPENLPGAKDDKIKVEHLTDEQLKAFEKSVK